jgi:hypothetical protein
VICCSKAVANAVIAPTQSEDQIRGKDTAVMKKEMAQQLKESKDRKPYFSPEIKSQKVLERAALACSGIFSNALYNIKTSYYTCGFNDS